MYVDVIGEVSALQYDLERDTLFANGYHSNKIK